MKFPWKLLVSSAIIATFCCLFFKDPYTQLFASAIGGALLGIADHVFKIGLSK